MNKFGHIELDNNCLKEIRPDGIIMYWKNIGVEKATPTIKGYPVAKYLHTKAVLHREDGPAEIYPAKHLYNVIYYKAEAERWYYEGKLHRIGGPALINIHPPEAEDYDDLDNSIWQLKEEWCLHGRTHREDGPAITYWDGNQRWLLNGLYIDVSSQEEFERYMKLKSFL
jgi:hypothetical protein